jgi:hypothetical protein
MNHCPGCQMPGSCRQDGHCRRPCTLDHAIKEAKEACAAMEAATRRLNAAVVNLAAAQLISKSQQP